MRFALGVIRRVAAEPKLARTLVPIAAVLIAAASYFPFRFGFEGPMQVVNGAVLNGDGTLTLAGPSVARTAGAPAWLGAAIDAETLDVSVLATPANATQRGPARIVTLSNGPYERNFMIAQKGVDLIVRARRQASDANGAPPLKVDRVFEEGVPRTIDVRFRRDVIEVYVDGAARYREPQETSPFALWDRASFQLSVGNEVTGTRPFDGVVQRLSFAVEGETATPLEGDTNLEIPPDFWHVPDRARALFRFDPSYAVIIAGAHAFAFAFLGALLWCARRGNAGMGLYLSIGVQAALFGGAVQLGKLAFDGRHPSLYHIIPDALGAVFGAWIVARLLRSEP